MTTRALIVEDTKLLRSLLEDALKEHNVADEVQGFEDAESFFDAYVAMIDEGGSAQLLVIDIELPGESGLSVGKRIREREESGDVNAAPIVFFSSRPHDDEIDETVAECFPARYVQKQDQQSPEDVAKTGVALMGEMLGMKGE